MPQAARLISCNERREPTSVQPNSQFGDIALDSAGTEFSNHQKNGHGSSLVAPHQPERSIRSLSTTPEPLIGFAGTPTAITPAGMSITTTLPAPIVDWLPTFARMMAEAPIQQSSPITTYVSGAVEESDKRPWESRECCRVPGISTCEAICVLAPI